MNNEYLKYLGLGLGGVSVGFAAGWFISKSVTTTKMRAKTNAEIEDMRVYFENRTAEVRSQRNIAKPTPEELFEQKHGDEELKLITDAYRTMDAEEFREVENRVPTNEELYAMADPDSPELEKIDVEALDIDVEELRNVNVFDRQEAEGDETDIGDEVPPPILLRDAEKAYIIPIGDYMDPAEDFEDFDRITVSYFEDDEVLVDEKNVPIPNVDEFVGLANLHKFGWHSDNKDIVYVRNEKKEIDFEIARVAGAYTEIVLGFAPKTSKRTQRMREDD